MWRLIAPLARCLFISHIQQILLLDHLLLMVHLELGGGLLQLDLLLLRKQIVIAAALAAVRIHHVL